MFKYLLVLLLLSTCSYANITLKDLKSKPTSHAKDFMIWQYLKQNITAKQADLAYKQVKDSKNSKLIYAYSKKQKTRL